MEGVNPWVLSPHFMSTTAAFLLIAIRGQSVHCPMTFVATGPTYQPQLAWCVFVKPMPQHLGSPIRNFFPFSRFDIPPPVPPSYSTWGLSSPPLLSAYLPTLNSAPMPFFLLPSSIPPLAILGHRHRRRQLVRCFFYNVIPYAFILERLYV